MVAGRTTDSATPSSKSEYRKIQELASGGMGSVELARALSGPRAGEIVAIKRLHPHLEREKHFADMFFDEAWITAGLHHPNVGAMFDWGTDRNGRYLAMEFVPGDSLLTLIREAKRQNIPIPIDLALFIIGKTAEGLHAAHELRNEHGHLRHLVHRDVTPSNILVGIHGEVKLIDFGVAKARDKLSHTSTGTIKGKFGYMSPEQARGFPIDRRSDVFSLGVVLWEVLALRRLYRSDSELEILRMIVEDPPQPIRDVRPECPPEVDNLIAGALAKNRDDRLGSCGEFAEFIWAIYHEYQFTAVEPQIAEYVRYVTPDRFLAIEQVLAGTNEFIEPTSARPASGSFSGSNPHDASGAVEISQRAPSGMTARHASLSQAPFETNPSLVAASYAAPMSVAPKSRGPIIGAIAAVGIVSLVGLGWFIGHAAPNQSVPNAASAVTPGTVVSPPPPPAHPIEPLAHVVVPPSPIAPPTAVVPVVTSTVEPAQAATSATTTTATRGGARNNHPTRTEHGNTQPVTAEQTQRAMLRQDQPATTAQPAHTTTTATAQPARTESPHSETTQPTTASRQDNGNSHPASGSGSSSGSSSGSGSTGSGSSSGGTQPQGARSLFDRSWGN